MRPKVLLLIALLIAVGFYCGCAVDMSSKDQTPDETDKLCESVPVIKRLGAYGEENPKALIRNNSGELYIVDINSGTAKKVDGFRPQ